VKRQLSRHTGRHAWPISGPLARQVSTLVDTHSRRRPRSAATEAERGLGSTRTPSPRA
jgi:hypothetical protein